MMHKLALVMLIVALVVLVGPAGPIHAQGGPCYGLPELGREYAAWSGPWVGHGRDIEVFPQGCGILTWRVYQWCQPGMNPSIGECDPVINGVIHNGGVVRFRLDVRDGVSTSGHIMMNRYTPTHGDGIVLRLNDDSTLTVEVDDTPVDFCRQWAYSIERCGI